LIWLRRFADLRRFYGVSTGVSPPAVTLLLGVSAVAVVFDVDSVTVLVSVEVSTSVGASGVHPSEKVNAAAAHRLRTVLTAKLSDWRET
jgi:hypothetical protein